MRAWFVLFLACFAVFALGLFVAGPFSEAAARQGGGTPVQYGSSGFIGERCAPGGSPPQIGFVGRAAAGEPISVDVSRGPAGSLGCLVISTALQPAPLMGCLMIPDPSAAIVMQAHVLDAGGACSMPMRIADPQLASVFYLQAFYVTPSVTSPFSTTAALTVTLPGSGLLALEKKYEALARLAALRASIVAGASGVGSPADAVMGLDDAERLITTSTGSTLWETTPQGDVDPCRIVKATGRQVFDLEGRAAGEIVRSIDKGLVTNALLRAEFLALTELLVAADRELASVAILDGRFGDDPVPGAAAAETRLADGDRLADMARATGDMMQKEIHYEDAIQTYADAWDRATL